MTEPNEQENSLFPNENPFYEIKTRDGHLLHEVVSALQKSIRRSEEELALYWAVEMDEAGYDEYCWKRLRIITSEDIGLANPTLPAQIDALYRTATDLKKKKDKARPERLMLIHAVLLLTRSPKSRIVDHALMTFYEGDAKHEMMDVARDKHTPAGRRLGRGFDHFFSEGIVLVPEPKLKDEYLERAKRIMTSKER